MNIFVLDLDPRRAAEYHCDKHVVKMILETAQLLYCAHWVLQPDSIPPGAYKKTHVNHPCAIWVRESRENYAWLCALGWWLCKEYTYRYDKTHKTEAHIVWLLSTVPTSLSSAGLTPIRMAMPEECKDKNPVHAYRMYYLKSKRALLMYKRRPMPSFLMYEESKVDFE
jgi:hypothetical protein